MRWSRWNVPFHGAARSSHGATRTAARRGTDPDGRASHAGRMADVREPRAVGRRRLPPGGAARRLPSEAGCGRAGCRAARTNLPASRRAVAGPAHHRPLPDGNVRGNPPAGGAPSGERDRAARREERPHDQTTAALADLDREMGSAGRRRGGADRDPGGARLRRAENAHAGIPAGGCADLA